MSNKLSRKGDKDNKKNKIQRGSSTVFANGVAVGLHTSPLVGPKPTTSATASPSVFADGDPVLRVSSTTRRKTRIVEGSPNVFVP